MSNNTLFDKFTEIATELRTKEYNGWKPTSIKGVLENITFRKELSSDEELLDLLMKYHTKLGFNTELSTKNYIEEKTGVDWFDEGNKDQLFKNIEEELHEHVFHFSEKPKYTSGDKKITWNSIFDEHMSVHYTKRLERTIGCSVPDINEPIKPRDKAEIYITLPINNDITPYLL
jgi:hypothetical protein